MATQRKSATKRQIAYDAKSSKGSKRPARDEGLLGAKKNSVMPTNLVRPGFMVETHGGGLLESLPEYSTDRAFTEGFESTLIPLPQGSPASERTAEDGPSPSFQPESSHGRDDRVEVANTERVPWRCICHLQIRFTTGRTSYATGWFVGPRTVVTAGHALMDPRSRAQASEVIVVPGRYRDRAPFGFQSAASIDIDRRWSEQRQEAYDFGAVFLPDPRLGQAVGWFGFAAPTDSDLATKPLVNNAGYPHETNKPFGTMWYNGGRIVGFDSVFLYYMIDTAVGQSGSPVFFRGQNDQRLVLAIHTYGSGNRNKGRRVTRELYTLLGQWAGA